MARLLSVNVGLPRDIEWQGKTVHTAIWKTPVHGRPLVRRLNVEGDGQGDLAGHGGEHRAVFVYQITPIATGETSSVETTLPTASSARTSQSKDCPTAKCASATTTASATRSSK